MVDDLIMENCAREQMKKVSKNLLISIRLEVNEFACTRGRFPEKIFLNVAAYNMIESFNRREVCHYSDGSSTLFGMNVSRYFTDTKDPEFYLSERKGRMVEDAYG